MENMTMRPTSNQTRLLLPRQELRQVELVYQNIGRYHIYKRDQLLYLSLLAEPLIAFFGLIFSFCVVV